MSDVCEYLEQIVEGKRRADDGKLNDESEMLVAKAKQTLKLLDVRFFKGSGKNLPEPICVHSVDPFELMREQGRQLGLDYVDTLCFHDVDILTTWHNKVLLHVSYDKVPITSASRVTVYHKSGGGVLAVHNLGEIEDGSIVKLDFKDSNVATL